MKAAEIMTPSPACCTPEMSARDAARLMEEHDCGCLPVVEDTQHNRVVGVVTDRDLALRALGANKGPETKVRDVMSTSPSCCAADDDLDAVEQIMTARQVRRVPVVDSLGCCVGIVAQADIVRDNRATTDREVARVVERISEPTRGSRRDFGVGAEREQRL